MQPFSNNVIKTFCFVVEFYFITRRKRVTVHANYVRQKRKQINVELYFKLNSIIFPTTFRLLFLAFQYLVRILFEIHIGFFPRMEQSLVGIFAIRNTFAEIFFTVVFEWVFHESRGSCSENDSIEFSPFSKLGYESRSWGFGRKKNHTKTSVSFFFFFFGVMINIRVKLMPPARHGGGGGGGDDLSRRKFRRVCTERYFNKLTSRLIKEKKTI